MADTVWQLNLSTLFGGAEVYTRFFSDAVLASGRESVVVVNRRAGFWGRLPFGAARIVPVDGHEEALAALPAEAALVMAHDRLPVDFATRLARRHFLTGFAHQPLIHRDPAPYRACRALLAVSGHVIATLAAAGLNHYLPDPLYGVADIAGRAGDAQVIARSPYSFDRRKVRDRLLSAVHPAWQRLKPRRVFRRGDELTLAVVSRFDNIKQFPRLFTHLAPVLARIPGVRLEVFGSGGYAAVRDLERALTPLGNRARLWGHQPDVVSVFRQVDWLMTGLPEREALGLNALEAQLCGTPVLAVKAPPFTETVAEGRTGLLYADPRQDAGADFGRIVGELARTRQRPDPRQAPEHLARFAFPAFAGRVAKALTELERRASCAA